jgi:CO/xanthine dehydrogenase FAD-binding subunit
MIIEYIRPERIEDAVKLINRAETKTYPMGGGTVLNRASVEQFAVVDLQALNLNSLERQGNDLHIGATVTLHSLEEYPDLQPGLHRALRREGNANLRQMASIAGTILTADGRSLLAGVLLALDAEMQLMGMATGGNEILRIGELLSRRKRLDQGKLVMGIDIPLHVKVEFEAVARTPKDRPVVYAAVALWPSGRTRVVVGGFGSAPRLVLDGPEAGGIEIAARNAYSHAGDEWASAAYRQEMAGLLALRCFEKLLGEIA